MALSEFRPYRTIIKESEKGGKILVISGILPPAAIHAYLRSNPAEMPDARLLDEAFTASEDHIHALLKKGGVISKSGEEWALSPTPGEFPKLSLNHLRIPDVLKDNLGYILEENEKVFEPKFYHVEGQKRARIDEVLQAFHEHITHEIQAKRVGFPRFSTKSLLNQVMIAACDSYGIGRIR